MVLAHDHPERLSESLDSVLGQTYSNLETIVVAPASADDELRNTLEQYRDRLSYCETESTSRVVMMIYCFRAFSEK